MNKILVVTRFLIRLAVLWVVDAISLLIMSAIVPGITLTGTEGLRPIVVAVAAALVLGIINLIIRPIFLLLALPLGFFVIFIVGFLLNAVLLMITAYFLPGFTVSSWLAAFIGGIVFSAINTVIHNIMSINDDDSFYAGLVERLAKKQIFKGASEPGQGIVMLEIDGLSYHHMSKVLDEGYMPTLAGLMKEKGYKLSRVETGIPSMTSSCQAGILYGDNYDIPSFRWFDRDLNRFVVSQMDAAMLDARYSKGQGLVSGGSSIGNMLNGDAEKSIFVIATMKSGTPEEKKRRAQDVYLLMLNPYFFVRSMVFFFWDVLTEIYQYYRQVAQNVQPRLNRLHRGYPLMRAGLTAVLKDIAAYVIALDILRGSPAIYHTYAGYDEMAHHAGPWTKDAFHELRRFDQVISRLLTIMNEKAPRPYELIVLSDHGQSFGATFLQRYGVSLKEFIEQNLPKGTTVMHTTGGDDGSTGVMSMMEELENIQEEGVGGRVGHAVVGGASGLLQRGVEERVGKAPEEAAEVMVAFSGNLANVYFGKFPERAKLSEINARYPGVVDALVEHEGVGFVVAYDDQGIPFCFGKKGARNLHNGDVTGEDPLSLYTSPYATVELRAEQVQRVADFPHAGDLIVNSTVYADGTVAAMEELIGNHGGVGGEQTDAFIFGPADMEVPTTKNSTDVFAILNARRGLIPRPQPEAAQEAEINPWAFSSLSKGFGQVGTWVGRALRAAVLDRSAYQAIAADAYMAWPAALILLLASVAAALLVGGQSVFTSFIVRLVLWLLAIIVTYGAGRLIGGKGQLNETFRAMGFAQSAYLWNLIGLIPGMMSVATIISLIMIVLGSWMGANTALKLKGWKTLLLPVVTIAIGIVSFIVIIVLIRGVAFTLNSLMATLGLYGK